VDETISIVDETKASNTINPSFPILFIFMVAEVPPPWVFFSIPSGIIKTANPYLNNIENIYYAQNKIQTNIFGLRL